MHEPTELAWIIAALSAIGRAGGGVIRRDTSYFADLAHWFAPVADHQLVTKLGAYFNLPRFVGNSEDYQFASEDRLVRDCGATPLLNDTHGDPFMANRMAIKSFAPLDRAHSF